MSGFFHFYGKKKRRKEIFICVSMPYIGLLTFLRMIKGYYSGYAYIVSMPYIGLLSFLRQYCYNIDYLNGCVSMPYIGLLSFLHIFTYDEYFTFIYSVNALHRASFISTVPSDKSLFVGIPSLVFAGNCQTI